MVNLHVRDIPKEMHDRLARAARRRGQSLQSYLFAVLEQQTQYERNVDLLAELPVVGSTVTSAEVIEAVRAAREGRDPEFDSSSAA